MHKTIYIDIDEEITSILDKIRDEESTEICIVVPKNAALTQGIINLKLLKKEVTKYGKTILIATNDPQARKVIKRLEIKTQEIAETDLKNDKKQKTIKKVEPIVAQSIFGEEENLTQEIIAKTDEHIQEINSDEEIFATGEIGSESFLDGAMPESIMAGEEEEDGEIMSEIEEENEAKEMRNDNFTPPNELRQELYAKKSVSKKNGISEGDFLGAEFSPLREMPAPKPMDENNSQVISTEKAAFMGRQAKTVRKMDSFKKEPVGNMPAPALATTALPKGGRVAVSRSVDFGNFPTTQKRNSNINGAPNFDLDMQRNPARGEDFKVTEDLNLKDFDEERSRKAEEFFGIEKAERRTSQRVMEKEVKKVEKQIGNQEGEKGFFVRWGFAMSILFLFVGIGVFVMWGYANYPQAEITIHPHKKDFAKEIKLTVKEGADTSEFEDGIILGQYKEMTIEKTMQFNATGETYASDDGKAKGEVTIYNSYSEEDQSLIATTRILSKEGKLFRLAKNVTVPGMKDNEAGYVEVAVIADEPGEEFNIEASTFTIEGFKGKPKYEKFEVKSSKAMTDGGSPDSNKKLSMISADDIARAREKTIAALEKSLEEEVKNQLGNETSAMFDSVEKEVTKATSTNDVKDIVKDFSYTVEQKVKLMTFAMTDVNSVALLKMKEDVDEGYQIEETQSNITFKKSITDFENKTMTMYLDSVAIAWPIIETQKLAESIAGKKEEEIKVILLGYPAIEKIEFLVKPSWLTGLPISKDKIEVEVVK
jgi:hypothetical protein